MPGALSHLRVLDLARVLAGPWCTQMLADLGADVIKVERPGTGDDTRHWGPPWVRDGAGGETGDSAYFTSTNRNKRSVCIDLARPEGQALARELAAKSDVLVENYKVGDLARYGLGWDDVRALNPRLVYCSITGYGQSGPYAQRPGYDFIFQAEGGLMSISGEADDKPGGGPMKVAIAVTDILAGLNATAAILAAIEQRHLSGQGQRIDVALMDSIVQFGANQIVSWFATGRLPRRVGNEHPNLTPYQVFRTADGHMVVGCGNDGQYRRLCAALGRDDLASDPRFLTMPDRNVNRAPMIAELQRTLAERPTAHWLERLADADIPNGPINDYARVFAHPQVLHRGLRVDQDHAAGGRVSTVANPIRLSDTPVAYRHAPPTLGQHTDEVLAEVLGRSPEEIAALRARGVV